MSNPEIENTILRQLYEAWFLPEADDNLNNLREQKGWEKVGFRNIVNQMSQATFEELIHTKYRELVIRQKVVVS
jgi:hypothetical protein